MEQMVVCGDCNKRYYCSAACRASDLKQHEIWCGRNDAELDIDIEVRSAGEGRGMGMFALRNFHPGDTILAERCAIHVSEEVFIGSGRPFYTSIIEQFSRCKPTIQAAILELHASELNMTSPGLSSIDKEVLKRWKGNFFKIKNKGCGLFITTARINHSCLSNCQRFFVNDHGLLVVSACREIAVGEELSISYTTKGYDKGQDFFQEYSKRSWGFVCICPSCVNPVIFSKISHFKQMEIKSKELGNVDDLLNVQAILDLGTKILQLCDELGFGSAKRQRIYYSMFEAAVKQRCNLAKAKELALKALENWELSIGGSKVMPSEITRARLDFENPELHKSYLLLES